MIVGLTGGIGSGKSTVAQMFNALGIPVYNSDEEAKKLMNSSQRLRKEITKLFGEASYSHGKLNKTYISDQIFNDKDKLNKLNKVVHPAVRQHFRNWAKDQKSPYVIQETAIIFENKAQASYDRIIVVTAPLESKIQRVQDRDDVSVENVHSRIKNQLTDEEKIPLSDYQIDNIDLEETEKKVKELHKVLLNIAKSSKF